MDPLLWLLAALVAVAPLVLVGLLAVRLWRSVRQLGRDVGEASGRVAELTATLGAARPAGAVRGHGG